MVSKESTKVHPGAILMTPLYDHPQYFEIETKLPSLDATHPQIDETTEA